MWAVDQNGAGPALCITKVLPGIESSVLSNQHSIIGCRLARMPWVHPADAIRKISRKQATQNKYQMDKRWNERVG